MCVESRVFPFLSLPISATMGCTSGAVAQQNTPQVAEKTLMQPKRRPSLEKIQVVADKIHEFSQEKLQVSTAAYEHRQHVSQSSALVMSVTTLCRCFASRSN